MADRVKSRGRGKSTIEVGARVSVGAEFFFPDSSEKTRVFGEVIDVSKVSNKVKVRWECDNTISSCDANELTFEDKEGGNEGREGIEVRVENEENESKKRKRENRTEDVKKNKPVNKTSKPKKKAENVVKKKKMKKKLTEEDDSDEPGEEDVIESLLAGKGSTPRTSKADGVAKMNLLLAMREEQTLPGGSDLSQLMNGDSDTSASRSSAEQLKTTENDTTSASRSSAEELKTTENDPSLTFESIQETPPSGSSTTPLQQARSQQLNEVATVTPRSTKPNTTTKTNEQFNNSSSTLNETFQSHSSPNHHSCVSREEFLEFKHKILTKYEKLKIRLKSMEEGGSSPSSEDEIEAGLQRNVTLLDVDHLRRQKAIAQLLRLRNPENITQAGELLLKTFFTLSQLATSTVSGKAANSSTIKRPALEKGIMADIRTVLTKCTDVNYLPVQLHNKSRGDITSALQTTLSNSKAQYTKLMEETEAGTVQIIVGNNASSVAGQLGDGNIVITDESVV